MPLHDPCSYRTVWISDLHLGTRRCRATELLAFLQTTKAETVYLVGDIFDVQAHGFGQWVWLPEHTAVMHTLLDMAARGVRMVYIPGNHDPQAHTLASAGIAGLDIMHPAMAPLADLLPRDLRDRAADWRLIEVKSTDVHTTAAGHRLLLIHGDQLDSFHEECGWTLGYIGELAYNWLSYRSEASTKRRKKKTGDDRIAKLERELGELWHNALRGFRTKAVKMAVKNRCQGVVCGHLHLPDARLIKNKKKTYLYVNDGDWTISATALVESPEGHLRLVYHDHTPMQEIPPLPA
jgi:UDP-2,3-diacylglucosamine pyrophosphatase LpxH